MRIRYYLAQPAIVLLLCLVLPGLAQATLKPIEAAYELALDQVQLPGEATGSLVVHACAKCPAVTLRVTAKTTWHPAPRTPPVPQAEILKQYRAAAGVRGALVYVYYQPGTGLVHRVVLDTAGGSSTRQGSGASGAKPTPAGGHP